MRGERSVKESPFGLQQGPISRTKTKASKHQQSKEKLKEFVPSTAPAEGNNKNLVALKVLQLWLSLFLHILINHRILSNICQLVMCRLRLGLEAPAWASKPGLRPTDIASRA